MTLKRIKFVEGDEEDKDPVVGENQEGNEMELDLEGSPVEGATLMEEGPVKKKLKKDLTQEAERKLEHYNQILLDSELNDSEKFSEISEFLEYIHLNNVNTFEFKTDFVDWCKTTLLTLIETVTSTSVECYCFLGNILKVAPTVIEPVCEKLLTFVYVQHEPSVEVEVAFGAFMEQLCQTFEKLRRFPKLIAKLLRCVKDNMDKLVIKKLIKKRGSHLKSREPEELAKFILSHEFMTSYCSILTMLPSGQVMDLWKTLQYNLEEGCVKNLNENSKNSGFVSFLTIVVDLTVSFLCSIKIDHSLPTSSIERVNDVMIKLNENVLTQLGESVVQKHDKQLIRPFLKLSIAWGHLKQYMAIYCSNNFDNYNEVQEAVDLSNTFPYISSLQWNSIWESVAESEDSVNIRLMVCLVALKLKNLAIIVQKGKELKKDSLGKDGKKQENVPSFTRSMEKAAIFIWNHQHFLVEGEKDFLGESREHILNVASAYMDREKLIDYAKTFLDNMLLEQATKSKKKVPQHQQHSIGNVVFHIALVLEAMQEGLKRIVKMNLMKRCVKKFLQECLSAQCKVKILNGLKEGKDFSEELKPFLMEAVEILNDSMTEKGMKKGSGKEDENAEHEPAFLKEIIFFLGQQELGQYPKAVKTLMFLCCSLIFTAVIGNIEEQEKKGREYKEIVKTLACLLSECGRNSQGNQILFHVDWIQFFQILVNTNKNALSEKNCGSLCNVILENVYLSSKVAVEFQNRHLDNIKNQLSFDTSGHSFGLLSLHVFNFLLKEANGKDPKSKSGLLLFSHTKELASAAISSLSDGSIIAELHNLLHSSPSSNSKKASKKLAKKRVESTERNKLLSNSFVSGVIQTCHLLLNALPYLNEETASECKVIVLPYLHFALEFLEVCKIETIENANVSNGSDGIIIIGDGDEEGSSTTPLFHCLGFLTKSLKSFEDYRAKLAPDFLQRLWDCSFAQSSSTKMETGMLKLILEAVNEEELRQICDSLHQRMGTEQEQIFGASVLSSLIEAEMANEKKKQIRRATVELSLYKFLEHVRSWKESENFVELAMPYLQFQTALLRRRKPMGNISALAVSLSSISTIPLDKIDDVETFKRVFSQVCELLNALTVHRLDVLSFRTHIFLQCFQFLLESLVKRADQRNKLTDREIYDLRHCGHCIERICQSAKLGKQEFTRAAPYLVVLLLKQFEKVTVYPIVKNALLNGSYKLLDMCDDKGISHVNSMLSPGSREIFKAVYDLYKKFYRYKGKV